MAKNIIILGGDTSTHELILSDSGHTKALKGDHIKWKIDDDKSIVKSIAGISLKDTTKDIVSGSNGERPDKEDQKNWKAKIADDVFDGDVCEYSIEWNDNEGRRHLHDPIISINPSV